MEKKIYILENLDCANCAAKIEEKFNAHPGVSEAVITFATRQLRLTADDPDALIPELERIARTVEKDVIIHARESGHGCCEQHGHEKDCCCGNEHHHHHKEGCSCGHSHHHEEGCSCGHSHHHEEGCSCGHSHHHEKDCSCGHDHHHEEGCSCGHNHHHDSSESLKPLLVGAVLMVLGLVLSHLGYAMFSLVVCLAAYILLGREVVATALRNLIRGQVFDENFLMSLATIGAFCIGEFPEAVGVMLFYRVGEYFEHRAVESSRRQIMEAVDLRPDVVRLVEGEAVREIPASQAVAGDLLLVRPGDRIPLDGTVITGESRVDTAPITGEPVPVGVKPGDSVISGCVNTSGQLTIRAEKPLSESMVTRILDSVENAAASKPKIDRFITRFARVYTPVVVAAAAATAVIPSVLTGNWNYWVYTALSFLVMSCPCALVLSVPLAFFSGIGVGSRKGILFKGGQTMEAMGAIKTVILDKTGTITRGDFRVQQVGGGHEVLQLCASCEQRSTHPIAQSIVSCARERGMTLTQPDSLEEFSGRGIRAVMGDQVILCGNTQLLQDYGVAYDICDAELGTQVLVAVDGRFVGFITIADSIKEDAADAIAHLKERGITAVMLTGDGEGAAAAVARTVGIERCYAKLLPQQKLAKLQRIRKELGAVMFVGDGINDAPVLAGADVGAAMGSGADAAIEAADVVFMTSAMESVPQALQIAADTRRIAWQNVVFALAIKLAVMILGLLGLASMWLAVFADSGVAMLCVLNSVRLLYQKDRER